MSDDINKIINPFEDPDPGILEQILSDRRVLTEVTRQSFFYFFYIYFGKHIEYPKAPFHLDMIKIAQDENIKRAVIMTFRNSAKSTILNTAYAIWSVLGAPQKKHVVIVSQTQQRVKDHLMNIGKEFENNQLLRENLGPFSQEDRWNSVSLVIPKYGARITAISAEEGVRGIKEGQYRPQIIIADDIEDSNSTKTKESREKTYNWFTGELLPLGEVDTKVIVLGNFLHPDSVCAKLSDLIKEGSMKGVSLKIPIIEDNGTITWPGKFPSLKSIEEFKKSIGNEVTWQRDFMLKAIASDYQIVRREWLHYYKPEDLPKRARNVLIFNYIGVDLAISQKETSDYTAIVAMLVARWTEECKAYVLPMPVNKRLTFPEIIEQIKFLVRDLSKDMTPEIFIENNGFQESLTQQLEALGIYATGIPSRGDKRERLLMTTAAIKQGKILFPEHGCEDLIEQIVSLGIEKHDDLADAFSLVANQYIIFGFKPSPGVEFINLSAQDSKSDEQSGKNNLPTKKKSDSGIRTYTLSFPNIDDYDGDDGFVIDRGVERGSGNFFNPSGRSGRI